jgi:hypothetical protein
VATGVGYNGGWRKESPTEETDGKKEEMEIKNANTQDKGWWNWWTYDWI